MGRGPSVPRRYGDPVAALMFPEAGGAAGCRTPWYRLPLPPTLPHRVNRGSFPAALSILPEPRTEEVGP